MDQQVCYIIGQDRSHLYGIACNNRAYMRQKYPNGAWYGIEREVWETANITSDPVQIEDSYSHSGDPQSDKIKGSSIQWGGTYCKEVNGSFPVIMVNVKVTTSPLPPHTMLNSPFSNRPLYTLYYKSKKLVMENIRGGCVCVCVCGGGGVCENSG